MVGRSSGLGAPREAGSSEPGSQADRASREELSGLLPGCLEEGSAVSTLRGTHPCTFPLTSCQSWGGRSILAVPTREGKGALAAAQLPPRVRGNPEALLPLQTSPKTSRKPKSKAPNEAAGRLLPLHSQTVSLLGRPPPGERSSDGVPWTVAQAT